MSEQAWILAKLLAGRVLKYVGPEEPDPKMDCDLEMWRIATDLLAALSTERQKDQQ